MLSSSSGSAPVFSVYFLWFYICKRFVKGESTSSSVLNLIYNSCFQICNQSQVMYYPLLGSQLKTCGVHSPDSVWLPRHVSQCMLRDNCIQWASNCYIRHNVSPQRQTDKKSVWLNITQGSSRLQTQQERLLSRLDLSLSKHHNICILYPHQYARNQIHSLSLHRSFRSYAMFLTKQY